MPIDLPRPLQDYLDAKRAYDSDAVIATLTPDAVISDEGHVSIGAEAIREWNSSASKALKATYALKAAERAGATFILTVEVAGNFPTSPVTLYFYAALRDQKIAALSIFGEKLPHAVAAYLLATNTFDSNAARATFLENALVNDIKREFHGVDAIVRWFDEESASDRVTMSPIEAIHDHNNVTLRCVVNGNYDKTGLPDPLILTYYFTIDADKISRLIILLNEHAPTR